MIVDKGLKGLLILSIIATAFLFMPIFAFAQTNNITTTTTTLPPQAAQQIAQQTPLASDDQVNELGTDLSAIFGAGFIGTLTTIIVTIKKVFSNKGKVDEALREKDYDHKKFNEAWKGLIQTGMDPVNKDLTFQQVLMLPAFPGDNIKKMSIAENISNHIEHYEDWFDKRYKDNPE